MSIIAISAGALMLLLALAAPIHAVGIWLALMVGHGMLVDMLGDGARNLPLVAAFGMLGALLMRGRVTLPDRAAVFLTAAILTLMIAAALTGLDVGNSFFWLIQYAKAFALALIVGACVRDEREVRLIACYLVGSLVFGALVAVWQYRSGNAAFQGWYEQRAATLRGDPNDTAMLLIAGVPLAAYGVLNAGRMVVKVWSAVALVILIAGTGVTGSRGGFVSLAMVLGLMYWRYRSVGTTVAGLLLVAVCAAAAPAAYWERMNSLITWQEINEGESLQSRQALLWGGLKLIGDNPLLGVGPGNFGAAFVANRPSLATETAATGDARSRQPLGVAHNLYLEFFVECGVLAGVALLAVFACSAAGFSHLNRAGAERPDYLGHAFAVSLSGMLFAGLFLSQGKNAVLWFLVGLGFAAARFRHSESAAAVRPAPPLVATYPHLMR